MRKSLFVLILVALASGGSFGSPAQAVPVETPDCNVSAQRQIDHSIKLGGDIGSVAVPCLTHGLEVVAEGVTIDLNGFTIRGNRVNDDAMVAEAGVRVQGFKKARIIGGAVRGFENAIWAFADEVRIQEVTAADNTGEGIVVSGIGAQVTSNIAANNGSNGFGTSGADHVFIENSALGNGSHGLYTSTTGAVIKGNNVSGNDNNGISAGSMATIKGNIANRNGDHGIDASIAPSVIRNSLASNGKSGIKVFSGEGAKINGNVSVNNLEEGIRAGGDDLQVNGNEVHGNGMNGILIVPDADAPSDGVEISKNIAKGNGYPLTANVGLGIDADDVQIVNVTGSGNVAEGNDDGLGCAGVTC